VTKAILSHDERYHTALARSPFTSPLFIFLFSTSTLLVGAALVYISIKSPFYWGFTYVPGVVLLCVFAISSVVGAFSLIRNLGRPSSS
jgi:hypothetical protein